MPTLKFSQFTTLATVSPTTTFFVGYDGTANSRFQISAIQLQDLGGQLDASTQLIGTINTGGATSITLGTYITFTGGDLNLSFGQYIRWDGNIGITMNNINNMELNAGSVLDVVATGAVDMPTGTNAQRPTGVNGMLRFNTDINEFEGYKSNQWYTLPDGNTTNASLSLQATSPYTLTLTDSAGGTVDVSLLPVANAGVISIDGADGVVTLVEGTGIDITTDTNFNTIEIATTVTDTTYLLESAAVGSNVDINLNASGTGTDSSITLVAGGNITLTENAGDITIAASGGAAGVTTFNTLSGDVTISAGTNITLNPVGQNIEISSTDTNTVYSYTAEQVGNNVDLKLNNITDATSDIVKIKAGSNITLTEVNDEVTIDADNDNTTYTLSSAQNVNDVDITLDASTGTDTEIKLVAGTGIGITDNGFNEITIDATASGVTQLNGGTGAFSIIGGGVDTNQQIVVNTNLAVDPRTIEIVPVQYQLALNASTLEFRNEGSATVIDSVNLGSIINDYETNVVSTNNGADIELNIVGGQNVSTVSIVEGTNISIQESGGDTITIAATGLALTLQDVTTNGNTTNVDSEFTSTGYLRIPRGLTTERPSQANSEYGMIRYNTDLDRFEGYGEVNTVGTWLNLSLPDRSNDQFTLGGSPDYTLTLTDSEGDFVDVDLAPLVAAASGVTSLNTLSGAVTLSAGSNVTLTPVGQDIEISSTDTDTTNSTLSLGAAPNFTLTLTDSAGGTVSTDLAVLNGGGGLQSLNGLSPADGAVSIVAGTNMSLTTDGDDDVTLNCTLTDTTYSLSFNSGTDVLTLTPSTGTADNIDLSSLVGVDTLNGLDGAVTISAGANVTLTTVGNDIEISATGGGGGTVGTLQQVTTQGETTTDEVEFNSTSHIKIPIGSTGQRPSPASTGYFRHNTTTDRPEVYDAEWRQLGTFTGVTGTNADFKFPVATGMIRVEDTAALNLRIMSDPSGQLDNIYLEPVSSIIATTKMAVDKNGNATPPQLTFEARGGDGMMIPKGSTAARPTGLAGIIRFNTTTNEFEGKYGVGSTDWISLGGSTPTLQQVMNTGSLATGLTGIVAISTSNLLSISGSTTSISGTNTLNLRATATGGSTTVNVEAQNSNGTVNINATGSSGVVNINSATDVNIDAGTGAGDRVVFGNYGSGTKSGTPAQALGVTSSGDVVEYSVVGSQVAKASVTFAANTGLSGFVTLPSAALTGIPSTVQPTGASAGGAYAIIIETYAAGSSVRWKIFDLTTGAPPTSSVTADVHYVYRAF